MEIDGVTHIADAPVLGKIDMRDLTERMHAGIGAPGAGDDDALAGKGLDSVGENTLDGYATVLRLPANERRAVIFDGEFVTGHVAGAVQRKRPARAAGVPRKNSSAGIGLPPARCNSTIRTAPAPHATVSLSSS